MRGLRGHLVAAPQPGGELTAGAAAVRSSGLLAIVVAAALAGCGAGERDERPRPAAKPPATADDLAIRCGLLRPAPGEVEAIVPEGLLPSGSFIAQARRSGSSARATILLPMGFQAAQRALAENAPRAGFKVIFSEQEPLEAEVYLSGSGGLVKFRIYASRQCPDSASQALFERAYTEG